MDNKFTVTVELSRTDFAKFTRLLMKYGVTESIVIRQLIRIWLQTNPEEPKEKDYKKEIIV